MLEDAIVVRDSLGTVTGASLKQFYADSDFDNGRTAVQHEVAFRNSVVRLAFDGGQLVGAARAVSDGVGCAAVFDVCVLPTYRQRGIATRLMRSLLDALPGQFVLLTCDASLQELYGSVGFGRLREGDVALARPDTLDGPS
jgi:predicted GNAT family acetyltransferase